MNAFKRNNTPQDVLLLENHSRLGGYSGNSGSSHHHAVDYFPRTEPHMLVYSFHFTERVWKWRWNQWSRSEPWVNADWFSDESNVWIEPSAVSAADIDGVFVDLLFCYSVRIGPVFPLKNFTSPSVHWSRCSLQLLMIYSHFFSVPHWVTEQLACVLLDSVHWFYLTRHLLAAHTLRVWIAEIRRSSANKVLHWWPQGYEFTSQNCQRDSVGQMEKTLNLQLTVWVLYRLEL